MFGILIFRAWIFEVYLDPFFKSMEINIITKSIDWIFVYFFDLIQQNDFAY